MCAQIASAVACALSFLRRCCTSRITDRLPDCMSHLVTSRTVPPSLDHLKQAQRQMSNFGAAVEQLLKQPAPQNEKLPTKEELASVNSEFSGQRNEVRQEPPTQLEVARLVAAIKRASE